MEEVTTEVEAVETPVVEAVEPVEAENPELAESIGVFLDLDVSLFEECRAKSALKHSDLKVKSGEVVKEFTVDDFKALLGF